MCQSLFFNKAAGMKPTFCEISKNIFFTEYLWTTASAYTDKENFI